MDGEGEALRGSDGKEAEDDEEDGDNDGDEDEDDDEERA